MDKSLEALKVLLEDIKKIVPIELQEELQGIIASASCSAPELAYLRWQQLAIWLQTHNRTPDWVLLAKEKLEEAVNPKPPPQLPPPETPPE